MRQQYFSIPVGQNMVRKENEERRDPLAHR